MKETEARSLSPITQRLLTNGHLEAEYDHWVPFTTDPGMSGLPVYRTDPSGRVQEWLGLISGSAPETKDTWLSIVNPLQLFERWSDAVQQFQKRGEIYKVYSVGNFIWMMSDRQLSRVGQNYTGVRFQESRLEAKPFNSAPTLRCNNGSGFRLDNGSGFRVDNGSGFRVDNGNLECGVRPDRGLSFITQRPKESPKRTAIMVMDHPDVTLFMPPTATGLGYYYMQSNLETAQEQFNVPESRRMKFKMFDGHKGTVEGLLSRGEFERFAASIYTAKDDGKAWAASAVATEVDKTNPNHMSIREHKVQLLLIPQYSGDLVERIRIQVHIDGFAPTEKSIEMQNLGVLHSIANAIQKVKVGPLEGELSLVGLLMHNPDLMNTPDLDMSVNTKSSLRPYVKFEKGEGDREIKTIFTMKLGERVFYITVPK